MYACRTVCDKVCLSYRRCTKLQLWELKISTSWVGFSSVKGGLSVLADGWWREKKKNGVEGLESMHTHWHTRTQWPHFERVQNKCRTVSRCAPKPLSVQSRHFLFVTPTLYKHWGMSAFLLKSITNEHARIVNSLQRVVIVLTGNLTHDENAARIGFSCYFHLSVTKDSLFEKKRDSERKE